MNLIRRCLLLMLCCAFSLQVNASNDFLKNKTEQQGFFSFYTQADNGKVFVEITEFEQQFLFQSGLPQGVGSNDIGLDRGQLGSTRLVQFERSGDKVFLRQINSYYRANSDNELEQQAVKEAFASSIIWGFKIAHEDEKSGKVYIDYTPFLLSDIHNLADKLKSRNQGSFSIDSSRSGFYAKRSKAFPDNTELEATITYKGKGTGQYLRSVTPDANAVTVNLHHSLIRLPDNNYTPRKFHPYSGYWAESYADYATAIDQPLVQRNIPRHRLAKKDPSAAISEAVEPIVYYLDAGVPDPVKTALLDGARWWNDAFAAIGYKNAFIVKMLPADADPMDVRFNVIQWVHRATRGWSYGASVIDPRTGEIIKGHVTLGSLRVRQDYLIALGLTSPFTTDDADTSKMQAMALARIRQLSAHEVGHTLGIAHNFAASVNDRASVMDYPHPLIELDDNDEISLENAYAEGIGVWDKYVVAYGYSDFTGQNEAAKLAELVSGAQSAGLEYMSDPDARAASSAHATGHLWDNGENAATELKRVLEVRKVALKNFGLNAIPTGTPLSELEESLVPIYHFHRFQVDAAAKLIAGIDYRYQVKTGQQNPKAIQVLDGKVQQQAFDALLYAISPEVLTLPRHIVDLIPPKAYGYYRNRESFTANTGITFDPVSAAQGSAKQTVSLLLNAQRLARLQQQSVMHNDVLSVADLIDELVEQTIKHKPEKGLSLLVQQRVNEQITEHLIKLWQGKNVVSEVRSEVYLALTDLQEWLDDNASARKYRSLKAHFILLAHQIDFALEQGQRITPEVKVEMPPGSPIGG